MFAFGFRHITDICLFICKAGIHQFSMTCSSVYLLLLFNFTHWNNWNLGFNDFCIISRFDLFPVVLLCRSFVLFEGNKSLNSYIQQIQLLLNQVKHIFCFSPCFHFLSYTFQSSLHLLSVCALPQMNSGIVLLLNYQKIMQQKSLPTGEGKFFTHIFQIIG